VIKPDNIFGVKEANESFSIIEENRKERKQILYDPYFTQCKTQKKKKSLAERRKYIKSLSKIPCLKVASTSITTTKIKDDWKNTKPVKIIKDFKNKNIRSKRVKNKIVVRSRNNKIWINLNLTCQIESVLKSKYNSKGHKCRKNSVGSSKDSKFKVNNFNTLKTKRKFLKNGTKLSLTIEA